ncbi:MAG: tyrosine-type recombinase/integrase [Atribacterota bacterium]
MKYSKEWLTKEEFNRLVNNPAISRRDELIISVLYYCALRVSEMVTIKVKNIDIINGTLTLWKSKKSDNPELIHIPDHLVKLISQWIRENNLKRNGYLIKSQKGGPLSRVQIYRIIKERAEEAGLDKEITTHSFRRSRATHLLNAGLPLEKVSRLLRHNRLESTMTYLKISIEDLKRDIKKVDKIEVV